MHRASRTRLKLPYLLVARDGKGRRTAHLRGRRSADPTAPVAPGQTSLLHYHDSFSISAYQTPGAFRIHNIP